MSQWGNLDYKELVGTVAVVSGAANVTATTGSFTTANVRPGDALLISNVKYRVASIDSNVTLTLSNVYTNSTGAGKAAAVQQSPKDLLTYGQTANVNYELKVGKRNVYGVDRIEIRNPDVKSKGISHTGWTHYSTWTNTQGSVRQRAETLVAMSKNFNANTAGTAAVQIDAADDTIVPDYGVVVEVQTTAVKLGNTASPSSIYSVLGNVIPAGPTVSYAWQFSPNNIVWVGLLNNNGPVNTGNATATLTIANIYATPNVVNGYVRAIVSATDTSDTATSNASQIVAGA
jgi:hypothetical protein